MMPRLLFLADTHLGFDLPARPRIERRRRGPDFFKAFEAALTYAREHRVAGVIHGGDLFFRSKIPQWLVERAFEPILELARRDIPVYLVPGNHERSVIPGTLFTLHDNIHIFNRPRTFVLSAGNMRIGLSGFPCLRNNIETRFNKTVAQTGWDLKPSDIKLLCLHQTIQGATVGPHNYLFRQGPDIIPAQAFPSVFDAVLAGHIHRHQVLTRDLHQAPLPCPVIYAGSTERTSFAEKEDPKGFVILDLAPPAAPDKKRLSWRFRTLKTRPMFRINLDVGACSPAQRLTDIRTRLSRLPADSVVQLKFSNPSSRRIDFPTAAEIRGVTPPTMTVTTTFGLPSNNT